MAITATGTNVATTVTTGKITNPKGILGKDDFMKLLLVELQHQDPTSPMDTAKILSQTSQLATLESTDKTNKALSNLATTLGNSQQFSTIAAIGKTASIGSDSIVHKKATPTNFELYFPKDVKSGTVEIKDSNGNVVKTLDVSSQKAGVLNFTWKGLNNAGTEAKEGVYHVSASYTDSKGTAQKTQLGLYPIEAVRFDNGKALVKLGSSYVALTKIKEVY